jgi:arabinoxylan arabinofuranohydrolase
MRKSTTTKPALMLATLAASIVLLATRTLLADGGYLFVTFKGEQTPLTEQIYFVVSDDGRNWQELNGGKPVLISELGEKGVRDPFLLRSHDGKDFFLIATDLSINLNHNWGRAVTHGSRAIIIWESSDLVHWSEPRRVEVAAPDAGCTWAPEAVYDAQAGDYFVFWASTTGSDQFKKQRIWSAHTKDFKTFSKPVIYIDRPDSVIDTDIVRDGDFYYRFSKDEHHSAITMDRSDRLDGSWQEVSGFSLAHMKGYEGPECYQLKPAADGKPATWCLMLDHFAKGEGYKPWVTQDLASGQFDPGPGFKFPFRLRHGSILPVSADELSRLRRAYP